MSPGVMVVGSINRDLTVITSHIPEPGETVLGSGHFSGPGGKGANQAVAVARLGCPASMVGRVGADEAGREMLATLDGNGVDTSAVSVDPDLPTGLALITLDESGENSIVVSPGANSRLDPETVAAAVAASQTVAVCLAQLEIPPSSVQRAASDFEGLFILNPAPARAVDPSWLEDVDVLVPNRSELSTLTGGSYPGSPEDVLAAVRALALPRVVVTLGRDGAFVFDRGDHVMVPPRAVEAIDTTGAGDAFCAALAVSLAEGNDIFTAASWACVAGAASTTKRGALVSMPTRREVERLAGQ